MYCILTYTNYNSDEHKCLWLQHHDIHHLQGTATWNFSIFRHLHMVCRGRDPGLVDQTAILWIEGRLPGGESLDLQLSIYPSKTTSAYWLKFQQVSASFSKFQQVSHVLQDMFCKKMAYHPAFSQTKTISEFDEMRHWRQENWSCTTQIMSSHFTSPLRSWHFYSFSDHEQWTAWTCQHSHCMRP